MPYKTHFAASSQGLLVSKYKIELLDKVSLSQDYFICRSITKFLNVLNYILWNFDCYYDIKLRKTLFRNYIEIWFHIDLDLFAQQRSSVWWFEVFLASLVDDSLLKGVSTEILKTNHNQT